MGERSRLRFPAMLLGMLSLALGLWAGLARLGWGVYVPTGSFLEAHGALMVNGVLATLIGLERAVALERRSLFGAPLLTGAGALAWALGFPAVFASGLLVAGSTLLLVMFLIILSRQRALHTLTQSVGAVCLLVGNALGLAGFDIPYLLPWWGSFLVLLIAAERLELTRVFRVSASRRALFAAFLALDLLACGVALRWFVLGGMLLGVAWVLLAAWLVVHDVAWRNLGRRGLPRFTAVGLLTGYVWLGLGGALLLLYGGVASQDLLYDAQLHAVFLGFVLSMVFAHAPIILPAVLGKPLTFRLALYVPLAVLHASLALRVGADLAGSYLVREWAGLFNVLAIVLFGLTLLATVALDSFAPMRRALSVDSSVFYP
ncbi:MAG: hypothetical protein KGJ23_14870 [Euryarchaeota archaeon]|nr:hypothetical protein [Euryarchaeota archaeon]MDE1881647.1 hypothetical protein [Euryarchaeota archaeon]MDE2046228.1 hypothetical protein [Thermoplasmata archaeon]